jgi:Protein of unknown function (DUF1064).
MTDRYDEDWLANYQAKRAGLKSAQSIAKVPKNPGKRKYRNSPTVVENIRFDSRKEADRWAELRLLEKAGKIQNLTRQVKFSLDVDGVHICNYIADFAFDENGEVVVEDVKSTATMTRVYLIKRNLMWALYRIRIKET